MECGSDAQNEGAHSFGEALEEYMVKSLRWLLFFPFQLLKILRELDFTLLV